MSQQIGRRVADHLDESGVLLDELFEHVHGAGCADRQGSVRREVDQRLPKLQVVVVSEDRRGACPPRAISDHPDQRGMRHVGVDQQRLSWLEVHADFQRQVGVALEAIGGHDTEDSRTRPSFSERTRARCTRPGSGRTPRSRPAPARAGWTRRGW